MRPVLFGILLTVAACNTSNTSRAPLGIPNQPLNLKIISPDQIQKAVKLSAKYPDESFYGNESEILVEFYMVEDENEAKKISKGKSSATSREQKKKKETETDDPNKEAMTTELRARVSYYGSVISLEDFNEFADAIFYNQRQKVSKVLLSYRPDDNDWFYTSTTDKSLDDDMIFYSDARMKVFSTSMPARGANLSYYYTVEYDNVKYLTNFFFHENFPLAKKKITFVIPEWLDASVITRNLEGFEIVKGDYVKSSSKITKVREWIKEKEDEINGVVEEEEEGERPAKRTQNTTAKLEYITYEGKDLAAWKREPGNAGPTHNLPHLILATKKYTKDGSEKRLLSDVADLYGWYHSLVKMVNNDSAYIRAKAMEITKGINGDREKIEAIFYWVQDNIRYIAFEDGIAGFKPESCQKVLKNSFGDCKGMANLTTQLLRSLGYDAHLTWIGTKRIAYDYSIPSIAVDNHMICALNFEGKRYFLDATEPYIALGDYGHRIQGRPVLIENGDTFTLDKIPDLSYERNKTEKIERLKLQNNVLTGTVKEAYNGESKTLILYSYNQTKADRKSTAVERFLSNSDINLKVSNISHSPLNNRQKEIDFNYNLEVRNHVLVNGNKTYINPEWDNHFAYLKLDTTRLTDYELDAKEYIIKECEIELPKGSKMVYLPKAVKVEHPEFRISLGYEMKGDKIIYKKTLILPEGKISRKNIGEWNAAQKQLADFYKDYIIIQTR